MRRINIWAVLSVVMIIAIGCRKEEYRRMQGMVWNTTYHITYESDKDLTDSVIAELKNVEHSVSAFAPTSIVSKINRNESFITDSAFREVYNMSLSISRKSGGAFDPTLAPLINAYGFGYERKDFPDQSQIDSILSHVGIEKTCLKGNTLYKQHPDIEFNFSAIAKGYGCDRVGRMFVRNGVKNYMVEIGGEIALAGKNPTAENWNISIDKPIFSADKEIHDSQMIVSLTDCGMATSGNYRNFKEIDGKRIAHTIDRFSGKPVLNDMLSATVIASTCMQADAYATACMSMGSTAAKLMAEKEKLAVMFVLNDGSVYTSRYFPKSK